MQNQGSPKVAYENGSHEHVQSNAPSRAHAEGYFAGASIRRRGEPLSGYALVGIDEYCRGVRAGYFVRQQRAERGVEPVEPLAAPAARVAGNRE